MLNKLNVKFSLLFLVLPTGLLVAQNCNDKVEIIFDNLVESIGNYSIEKPEFKITSQKRNAASMNLSGIKIEQYAIDLFCGAEDFDDYISYILAHELAHYYKEHKWMSNTGLGYVSPVQEELDSIYRTKAKRKESEIQADLYAGFYGKIAGYSTLEKAEETLTVIYDEYGFPKENPKYPSFDERIDIINSKIKVANDLALLFELGNVLLLDKKYKEAMSCYKYILRSNFNSREIHNNLGLSYLMQGISVSRDTIMKSLVFPVSLEQTTRAEVNNNRSSGVNESKKLIKEASNRFKRALLLDLDYQKASINLAICEFLLHDDYKSRKNYLEGINGYDSKFVNDLKIINLIMDRKTNEDEFIKLVDQGSHISKLNFTKSVKIDSDEKDIILRKLGFSPRIRWESGEDLLESAFQLTTMRGFEIINNYEMELAIIRIPESDLKELTALQTKSLVETNKGTYLVY